MKKGGAQPFIILSLGLVALVLIDLALGSVVIPLVEVAKILLGSTTENEAWKNIILEFRLPRILTTLVAGAGLSVCGLLMQTLFRNPLAGPFVLGISSGASLGVAFVVLAGSAFGLNWLNDTSLTLAAVVGSGAVLLLVISVSHRISDAMALLIIGLMFASASGALVSVLEFFSSAEETQSYLIWTFGSLGGTSWQELNYLIPTFMLGIVLSLFSIKGLNALLLGENYAQSMGVNRQNIRLLIVLSTGLLAGSITAFCGPIAFIGLAIPHVARIWTGSNLHGRLLPACMLIGAVVLLICDIVSQLPGSQHVLPINVVTSILGAPFVIWLVIRKKNLSHIF